jgi:Uma2 family endonuclease
MTYMPPVAAPATPPASTSPPPFQPPRRFANAAEWVHSLGDVPLERIVFDPWPGTATEADLVLLADRDKRLCELIDGTLVEKPLGYWESVIALDLASDINLFVRPRRLGTVSGEAGMMRLLPGRVRLPDVAFVSAQRLAQLGQGGSVNVPVPALSPELAVEVLSESNTAAEIEQKIREYFQSGTLLVWVIDRRPRTVAVYHATGAPTRVLCQTDVLDGEKVLPGFTLPVAEVFRSLPAGA